MQQGTARSTFGVVVLTLLCSFCSSVTYAQEWATKMFSKTDHDFGVVARGSDTVYKFEVKNRYKEDIVLKSVRSSCGCTSPSLEGSVLKTYETGNVVAKFNTRTFTGIHSATLTVQLEFIDSNGARRPGQVQLRVHGDIRGDVVFQPGSINLGSVDQGTIVKKSATVTYQGRSGWKIEDVRSANSDFEVELNELRRSGGRVVYDLLVRLKDSAKPGFLKNQLILVTNDSRTPRIPLDVEGNIVPEISVAPVTLALGDIPAGEEVKKRLLVRGKKPFRVTSVTCGETDGCFEFKTDDAEKERHFIEVTFHGKKPGRMKRSIVISTSRGDSFTATCTAYAHVLAPAKTEKAEPTDDKEDRASVASGSNTEASEIAPEQNLAQDR